MQEWKASEKEAQKMTHDGAISVNLVTGEATHISDRPPEQDYSSADETAGVLNRAADEAAGHVERRQTKKARRKRRDTFREGEAAYSIQSVLLQFVFLLLPIPASMAFRAMAHSSRLRSIWQATSFDFVMSPLTSRLDALHPPEQ